MMTFNRPGWGVVLSFSLLVLLVAGSASAQTAPGAIGSMPIQTDMTGNWLHYGYDSLYTSYNPAEHTIGVENVAQLEFKWGIGCDDRAVHFISRSPAIYRDTLYLSDQGLSAYHAQTGELRWHFDRGNINWEPQPVVAEDGMVFYLEGTVPTYLYALDGQSGDLVWEAPLGFDLGTSNAAMVTVDEENGRVYLVEMGIHNQGKLFALEKQTGAVAWFKSAATDNLPAEGDTVLLSEGKIYVDQTEEYYGNRVVRIDAASQAVEAKFAKPDGIELEEICRIGLCNGRLLVTYCDRDDVFEALGALVVYDAATGDVLWQQDYGEAAQGTIACHAASDRIYVPVGPSLYALEAATGQAIWTYTGASAVYNPSLANGVVYVVSETEMIALDEATGEPVFSYTLGTEGYESPLIAISTAQVAISQGMIYFPGNRGACDLYALGLPDGSAE